MNNPIAALASKKVLLAAHRGVCGGNIPCNTPQAFEIALRAGADILEIDVTRAADGTLYVFHPGKEKTFLRADVDLTKMTAAEIDQMPLMNPDQCSTPYHVSRLDDVLELLKDRCIINVDKFWDSMPEITACIRRHGMQEQVLVKTGANPDEMRRVAAIAPDLPYMPVCGGRFFDLDACLQSGARTVGVEICFGSEQDLAVAPETLERIHQKGLVTWANAIVFSYKSVLAAGHSDDRSMLGDPAGGWGWLVDRGFDILQTDWTLQARLYLESSCKLWK
jgi:glycerophosphoryl diester phosphodiesterase